MEQMIFNQKNLILNELCAIDIDRLESLKVDSEDNRWNDIVDGVKELRENKPVHCWVYKEPRLLYIYRRYSNKEYDDKKPIYNINGKEMVVDIVSKNLNAYSDDTFKYLGMGSFVRMSEPIMEEIKDHKWTVVD